MIKPFCRHFPGLTIPILVLVRRDRRKVTFRSFRERAGDGDDADLLTGPECERLATEHAEAQPGTVFTRRPFDGGHLAARLKGRLFQELGGVCLDLDGALGKGEWSDRSSWVFPLDRIGKPRMPFNRYIVTSQTKARTPRMLAMDERNCSLQIYAPFASCDFDSCSFSVALNPEYGMAGNLDPGIEVTMADVLGGAQKPFAEITLSADTIDLAPDAYGTVTAQLVDGDGKAIRDADAELYLEVTGGYLPKQRVATEKGKAKFRVGALGLDTGDSFRVKVGFRHFTSVAELTVRVV